MRDFRFIMKFEREWKDAQEKMSELRSKGEVGFDSGSSGGGGLGLEDALNSYLDSIGEDGTF